MKELISCVLCISWLTISAFAATGTSPEFRVDLDGMGPWERRTARAAEAISYSSAWATNALTGAKAVVTVNPVKKDKPKYIAIDLSGGTAVAKYPIEYLDDVPAGGWTDEYKTSKLVLRHIPAGSFIMGGRYTDYPGAVNTNLHMVTLTKDFYMGVFEVTQRQWELVMGNRPSRFTNETCYATRPVECVSYIDIRGGVKGITWPETKDVDDGSFIGKVRRKSGLTGFDLPTEAQWEYACRAGTTTALNNGENLSTNSEPAIELLLVGRNRANSGLHEFMQENQDKNVIDFVVINSNEMEELGTAKVGTYLCNAWKLYDCHGNVEEWCIDEESIGILTASLDPIGATLHTTDLRVYRGGGWTHMAYGATSGYREWQKQVLKPELCQYDRGFRLCLQGGELPELAEGQMLVNVSGANSVSWTPTKAGTYYLTHETQTNGVNAAEVLGAWFTVEGPKLAIEPQGELTNGVTVAIMGAGEGWTIRYEVGDANEVSRPTAESPEYVGPFVLNESATVRAVAFSDGGIESEEVVKDLTLHPALSVSGIAARQRYPWNGKVDVDFTLSGDPDRQYLTTLAVEDITGGTNLPIRTAWQKGSGTTNTVFAITPGAHGIVWDANADIANDAEFPEVAVHIKAQGSGLLGKEKAVTMTVAGYTGAETLRDVPVLVRISESIDGFRYADCPTNTLVFMDEAANVALAHEIDEWHEDGESLVWVKVPELKNGTKFVMAYGGSAANEAPHEVWRDYAGVWHMNEDSGTAYDSTANRLDAQPDCGTNGNANTMAQMVAYETGACGRARVNSVKLPDRGNDRQNFMLVPAYDAIGLSGRFLISGWFNGEYWNDGTSWFPRLISRRSESVHEVGWEVSFRENAIHIDTATTADDNMFVSVETPNMMMEWCFLSIAFDNGTYSVFTNGIHASSGTINQITDNGLPLAFGNTANGSRWSFVGQYDEIRLRGGALSADRIKADYDMIANRNWLTYGKVEDVESKVLEDAN